MRRRHPRFSRLKFRDLDSRALESVRSMLVALEPAAEAAADRVDASGPTSPGDPNAMGEPLQGDAEWVLGELERLIAASDSLQSPLSYFAVERAEGRLLVIRAEAVGTSDPDEIPIWNERLLGEVRRLGERAYEVTRSG
jgi:hypothetical protein